MVSGMMMVLVATGVVVSWQSIERQRRQQADIAAFHRHQSAGPIALPPPDHPHAGS